MSKDRIGKSELKVPAFATEGEEAKWWFENDGLIADEFEKAEQQGRLGTGGVRSLLASKGISVPSPKATPTTTIRLDPDDIAKARVQAEARGLRYQTYLKMLIHEALVKEEQQKASAA